jgi:aldehyde dehydrogenase (NAD+)
LELIGKEAVLCKKIIEAQQRYFSKGVTQSISFRIEQLKKLKSLIQQHENEILDALKKDLNKSHMEAYTQEVMLVINEIDHILKNLNKWVKPQKQSTPLSLQPARSKIIFEPYGSVLIISPWNYPFLLTLSPLVGAICAGNCAVIKPSEFATHSERLLVKLINQHFPHEFLTVIQGDHEETQQLLNEKFDYIFFTGGSEIGKKVMTAAAKNLIPVTLELGGKSPCIVDETANIEYAARRIIWGKMSNAGQMCIAPDYIYVHESLKAELVAALKDAIQRFYGDNPKSSNSFGRIINQKQFVRLTKLLENGHIIFGGEFDAAQRYMAPTLIDGVAWNDDIMQNEIFGPILPILTYTDINTMISTIKQHPKSLALYLFTNNKNHEKMILNQVSFGNGCVNDCVMQIANVNLPFGGVGLSGIGQYHGKFSFETFSHRKSIFKKSMKMDFDFLYPPYDLKKLNIVKKIMRWL